MENNTIDLLKTLSNSSIAIFGAIALFLKIFQEVLKKAFTDKDNLKTVVEEQKRMSEQLRVVITELKLELSELETLNVRNHSEIMKLIESGNSQKLKEYLIEYEMHKAVREAKRQ
jgi:hypothetical protein